LFVSPHRCAHLCTDAFVLMPPALGCVGSESPKGRKALHINPYLAPLAQGLGFIGENSAEIAADWIDSFLDTAR
jgi:hypothetical protein